MMKKETKNIRIVELPDEPIYLGKVTLLIGDLDEANEYLKDKYAYVYTINAAGAYLGMQDSRHWIYLSKHADMMIVLHECVHLVAGICKERGLNPSLTEENGEWLAGYITYWTEKVSKEWG